ncbi:hypothetical protein DOLIC_00065 [Dolichomitus sp. PSUC_FEM 10030005]|nr:hypothetical protein [Dolichomitus sp. PSUC_FEM 10030005]
MLSFMFFFSGVTRQRPSVNYAYDPHRHGAAYTARILMDRMKYPSVESYRRCLMSQDILFEYPIIFTLPTPVINIINGHDNINLPTILTAFQLPVIQHATLHVYPGTQLFKKRYILTPENKDFVAELLPRKFVSLWPALRESTHQWLDDEGVIPYNRHCMVTGVQFMININKKTDDLHELYYEYRIGGKVEVL